MTYQDGIYYPFPEPPASGGITAIASGGDVTVEAPVDGIVVIGPVTSVGGDTHVAFTDVSNQFFFNTTQTFFGPIKMTPTSTTVVPLTLTPPAGMTADMIDVAGLAVSKDGQVTITSQAVADVPLTLGAAAGQTAPLMQAGAGNAFLVTAAGNLTLSAAGGNLLTANGFTIASTGVVNSSHSINSTASITATGTTGAIGAQAPNASLLSTIVSSGAAVHLTSTQTTPPTIAAGPGATSATFLNSGTTPVANNPTDVRGNLTITTAATITAGQILATITFEAAYAAPPTVYYSDIGLAGAVDPANVRTTGFDITGRTALAAPTTSRGGYIVAGS